jgi:UDP-N-acetyl-D-mannosaminuronic acid dehydrogenase
MVTLARNGLTRAGKSLKGSKIALLGWAFLANSDDARNTPSEIFRNLALDGGAQVVVHDPWVEAIPDVPIEHNLHSVLKGADAVVIFTGHDAYKNLEPAPLKSLMETKNPLIVDGRNSINPDAFIAAGFVYQGIGRGDKNSHLLVR